MTQASLPRRAVRGFAVLSLEAAEFATFALAAFIAIRGGYLAIPTWSHDLRDIVATGLGILIAFGASGYVRYRLKPLRRRLRRPAQQHATFGDSEAPEPNTVAEIHASAERDAAEQAARAARVHLGVGEGAALGQPECWRGDNSGQATFQLEGTALVLRHRRARYGEGHFFHIIGADTEERVQTLPELLDHLETRNADTAADGQIPTRV